MTRRGFTIVELIITITVMGILLLLAVVNIGSTQANARDEERKADIEAISNSLERFYKTGTDDSTTFNRYPSLGLFTTLPTSITKNLLDIDLKSFQAPSTPSGTISLIAAQTPIQTGPSIPQPSVSQYVYQPLKSDGTLCYSGDIDCRKFNLYYKLESGTTVYKVMSKNQ